MSGSQMYEILHLLGNKMESAKRNEKVLIFVLNIIIQFYTAFGSTTTVDGYIPHPNLGCKGNDLGGYRTSDMQSCKQKCDDNFMCAAFQHRRNYGTNCWIKSLCDQLAHLSGGWIIYTRMANRGGCTFDEAAGYALYGHNQFVTQAEVNGCKNKCLRDSKCLSFDHNINRGLCFISYESKETEPSSFGLHTRMTYYQKRCGPTLDLLSRDILHASDGSVTTVKDGHCIQSFGPYGGNTGTEFSDVDMAFQNITVIQVYASTYINSIAIQYGSAPLVTHGRYRRQSSTTTLADGEYITTVLGRAGTLVDQLTFITNQRTIGTYGSGGGLPFKAGGEGRPLLYISGRSASYINKLAFHFQC